MSFSVHGDSKRGDSKRSHSGASPIFFADLNVGNGQPQQHTTATEAQPYHLSGRRKQNLNLHINPGLLRDPAVTHISPGSMSLDGDSPGEESEGGFVPSNSDLEGSDIGSEASALELSFGRGVECLLSIYLGTVVPIARAFSSKWKLEWNDDLQHMESSPMLAYAAAAYTAAYLRLVGHDDHQLSGLWLDCETKAVSLLRHTLRTDEYTRTAGVQQACSATVALLMRLALLLGDVEMALVHAEALQRMPNGEAKGWKHEHAIDIRIERAFASKHGLESGQRKTKTGVRTRAP